MVRKDYHGVAEVSMVVDGVLIKDRHGKEYKTNNIRRNN